MDKSLPSIIVVSSRASGEFEARVTEANEAAPPAISASFLAAEPFSTTAANVI